jgi:rhodanese-related sulfurtransferase
LFKGVLETSIIKIFDLTVARTGLSENEAKEAGLPYRALYIPGNSNATYYPGAEQMMLKIVFEVPTGKLLGAQVLGGKGADKRIDVLATAIYSSLTVFDLENLDLAYAPPYASAKDPVIMCGMVASNMLRSEITYVNTSELASMLTQNGVELLDVRTEEEYTQGHIEGALLIPVDELRQRLSELDRAKTYVVYCAVGYRAYNACLFLQSQGYKVYNLSGGYKAYTMCVRESCGQRRRNCGKH